MTTAITLNNAAVHEHPGVSAGDEDWASCTGRLVYNIPTRLQLIELAVRFACGHLALHRICNDERAARIGLALHEALTNAMIHGNLGLSSELKEQPDNAFGRELAARCFDAALSARRVKMSLAFAADGCDISIEDEGEGFDYASVAEDAADETPPDNSALRSSGRGILIMRAFSDELRFSRDGRCVIMSFRNQNRRARSSDRRETRRLPYSVRVEIRYGASMHPSDAFSRDLSSQGMAFVSPIPVPLGPVELLLPAFEGSDEPAPVMAMVVRCQRMTEGVFDVGCRFDDSSKFQRFSIP